MIASLAMYPFDHLRDAQDELWAAVRDRLPADAPAALDRDTELHAAWHRPDLLVGQTCGWPLVTELADEVTVIGTFDVVAPFAEGGCYRSVLVAQQPLDLDEWRRRADVVVAVNHGDSLSGWVSFCAAWGGVPSTVLDTGAHLGSMRAIAAGRAHLAAIDALSFQFIAEAEPATAARVHVIGHCPVIPCLPLVMANGLADRLEEVRAAIAGAVADPALAAACARLRIRGFVPLDFADYAPLLALRPGG